MIGITKLEQFDENGILGERTLPSFPPSGEVRLHEREAVSGKGRERRHPPVSRGRLIRGEGYWGGWFGNVLSRIIVV